MVTITKRKTISFKPALFQKLQKSSIKNKSLIVNMALDMYFRKEELLKQAEKSFWKKELKQAEKDFSNGNFGTINPNNEIITDELLEKELWSKIEK